MTQKAIGYVRVSTEEQAKEGISIDAQKEKLHQYAELYNIELIDIKVDAGQSAKSLDRVGLEEALATLGTGNADALLIYKLDRLTRSVADLGRLIDKYFNEEYQLLSVTDHIDTRTANGRLILNVLGSVSQWERETIVERTEASLQYLKEERRVYNHPPLGYHAVKGYLRADKEEQLIVGDILELHDKGLSMRKVANNLNSRGITGKRGGKFYASTIRAILRNNIHQKAA